MSTTRNGRTPRTSLAQQIDRLDLILDNLSEGLQEAVSDAVKTAVTRAVEAALVEVLTNAELRRRLVPESAPAVPARASRPLWTKVAGFARGCWQAARVVAGGLWSAAQSLTGQALAVGQTVSQGVQRRLTSVTRRIWRRGVEAARFFRQVRRSLAVALGIGVLVGLGCFVAGPIVASTVSGFAGFVGSLATVLRSRRRMAEAAVVVPHAHKRGV